MIVRAVTVVTGCKSGGGRRRRMWDVGDAWSVSGGRATSAPTTAEEDDAERVPELGRQTRVEDEVYRAVDDDE